MSLVRKLPLILVLMLVTVSVAAPLSDGDIVGETVCNNVSFVTFTEKVSMDINDSADINVHITNKNSTVALVKIDMQPDPNIKFTSGSVTIPVKPSTTVDELLTLTTTTYSHDGDYLVEFNIQVIVNGVEESCAVDGNIHITSKYSSNTSYNKYFGIFTIDLPAPFNEPIVTTAITFIGWIGIAFLAALFLNLILKFIFRFVNEEEDLFGKEFGISVSICILMIGITNCMHVFGCNEKVIAEVSTAFSFIYVIFGAFIIWYIYKAIVFYGLHAVDDHDDSTDGFDVTLIPLFNLIGKVLIVAVAVGMMLTMLGLNISAIITGAGIAGLGVSLGAKPAINELFSGIVVLTTRPFKVGDTVTIGSNDAMEVTNVGVLKTTFVTNYTNEFITMPNSVISSSKIVNHTCNTRKFRIYVFVKVAKDSNLLLVKKLLKDVANEHPHIVKDNSVSKPSVIVSQYRTEEGGIKMRLAVYVDEYGDHGSIGGELREAILKKFRENGITVPLRQLDITISEMPEELNATL